MDDSNLTDTEVCALLRQRMAQAGTRVAMAVFARGDVADSVDNNGTVSLLHLPDAKLIITNHHVWDRFRKEHANDPDYRIALTGQGFCHPIDISDSRVISENEEHDLCVLSYSAERLEAVGKEFYISPQWPPKRAATDEDILIAGYPGMCRSVEAAVHPVTGESVSVLHHELVLLYPTVEAVSERQLLLKFRSPTSEVHNLSGRPIDRYRWGGMSGSLVYRLDAKENRFVPCGILHAAGEGLNAVFVATHLDLIGSDGVIAQPPNIGK